MTGTFSGPEEFYRALQGLRRCITHTSDRGLHTSFGINVRGPARRTSATVTQSSSQAFFPGHCALGFAPF
jgi:hypothetical protein